jgi:DNA-binding response OmpR family regulator
MLTARDSVEAKVLGLEAGADDYLTKPFDVDELVARLRVFERRLATSGVSCLSIADVELDINSHTVTMAGSPLVFSRREYMLLKALMESAGRVLSKEQLESKLYSWGEEVSSNTIEVHIHNLRKKLPKDFIKNIRGIGYTVKAA